MNSGGADHEAVGGRSARLAPECSPKLLEEPAVYNRRTDELYFVNDEALAFLAASASGAPLPVDGSAGDFIDFCFEEGILEINDDATPRRLQLEQSPLPSLRYLLLHITDRCNLACRHCFLGNAGSAELDLDQIAAVVDEFETLQGLRLMVSGGEPLLHPQFQEIDAILAGRDIRTVLLTNGTLLDETVVMRSSFEEVQLSLDGIGPSHDHIRGPGSFDRTLAAARLVTAAGLQLSVATMVHSRNLDEFGRIEKLVRELGAREWSIDLPCDAGRLADNRELLVEAAAAGPLLNLSFGGAIHEPSPGFACGAHLMAVMADGVIARCGFYSDDPLGTAAGGLAAAWGRFKRISLDELECDCQYLTECRGGCRFRALEHGGEYGIDPCQCFRFGVAR